MERKMSVKYIDDIGIDSCLFCRSVELDICTAPEGTNNQTTIKYQVVCKNCGTRGPLLNSKESAALYWNLKGGLPIAEKAKIIIDNNDYNFDICVRRFRERIPHFDKYECKELVNEVLIDHANMLLETAHPNDPLYGFPRKQFVPGEKI